MTVKACMRTMKLPSKLRKFRNWEALWDAVGAPGGIANVVQATGIDVRDLSDALSNEAVEFNGSRHKQISAHWIDVLLAVVGISLLTLIVWRFEILCF